MNRSVLLSLVGLVACSPSASDDNGDDTDPAGTDDQAIVNCTAPARPVLADIPDQASLDAAPGSFLALFAVDGDELVGKSVRDADAAEGAMGLWQELILRIPTNQREDLVQFGLFESDSLAGYVDNTGTANFTGRYGTSLQVTADYAAENEADPCAPLSGHRGTYDWTLIHEFSHLRHYADGATSDFTSRFRVEGGDGEGYPEDGSPQLTGDFVTSYAERAGGDEDAAESFTAYVMLGELPLEYTLAADKVRFFDGRPGYPELRQALRVTEPGGGGEAPAAPRREFPLEVANPAWLVGEWTADGPDGAVEYDITASELVVRIATPDGLVTYDYAGLRDNGDLAVVKVVESNESFHLYQVAIAGEGWSETFMLQDDGTVEVQRERVGEYTLTKR